MRLNLPYLYLLGVDIQVEGGGTCIIDQATVYTRLFFFLFPCKLWRKDYTPLPFIWVAQGYYFFEGGNGQLHHLKITYVLIVHGLDCPSKHPVTMI